MNGATYEVYYGGSSNGTPVDGLYTNGDYTPGTKYTDFTISSMVTNIGGGETIGGPGGDRPGGIIPDDIPL